MLNALQSQTTAVFGVMMDAMMSGAYALFDISVLCGVAFWLFEILKAMQSGGGIVMETMAKRVFALSGLTALVHGWQWFTGVIQSDVTAFAAHLANADPLVVNASFTPDGIIEANRKLTTALNANGAGHGFHLLSLLDLWKVVSIGCVQIGSTGLAVELFLGNIALPLVLCSGALLVGFIVNPWLSSFAQQYFSLILGSVVFVILIGLFVGIGQTLALAQVTSINDAYGALLPGPQMLSIGGTSLLFALFGAVVPALIASKIAGGSPFGMAMSLFQVAARGGATAAKLHGKLS